MDQIALDVKSSKVVTSAESAGVTDAHEGERPDASIQLQSVTSTWFMKDSKNDHGLPSGSGSAFAADESAAKGFAATNGKSLCDTLTTATDNGRF